jgi:hypothetical protein
LLAQQVSTTINGWRMKYGSTWKRKKKEQFFNCLKNLELLEEKSSNWFVSCFLKLERNLRIIVTYIFASLLHEILHTSRMAKGFVKWKVGGCDFFFSLLFLFNNSYFYWWQLVG